MENFSFSKLLPKNIQFWSKSQNVVGIDIGSSSIKVIQLRKEKEQAILETYGELAAGPYAELSVGQVVRLSEDRVIEMLKDLFKEAGVNAKKGVIGIPLKSSFLTTMKLPQVSEKEMGNMIRFEARKYIPVSLEEVELDWWILPSSKGQRSKIADEEDGEEEDVEDVEKMKIKEIAELLLVAIHKDTLQKYRDIASRAGLKTVLFEIEIFSMLRSILSRQTVPVMIIDLGASSTKMSIVDYGILRMTHNVDKGAQELTNAIARSLSISFERAEEMKYEIGLSVRPEHQELVSVMEPVLNFIFSEAKQLMADYRRKHNEPVGRVILSGGGSLLNNLVDTAVKSLGIEVSIANPLAKTQYPPFLQEVLKGIGPTFSVAAGLAMREL